MLNVEPADTRVRRPYPELLAFAFLTPISELLCFVESRFDLAATNPLTSDVEVDAESGLGGKLFTRGLVFGGAGKAPILVVFRRVFPGVGRADAADVEIALPIEGLFSVGTAGVDWVFEGFGVGKPEVITDLESGLLAGVAIEDDAETGLESGVSGISDNGFRVFPIGSAGRGPDGGAEGGGGLCEGRCGIADVIVAVAVKDIALFPGTLVRCCRSPPLPSPKGG